MKSIQLVPIGHSLHTSESGHPEYLCMVSREYPVAAGAAQLNELSSDRAQFLQKKAMNGWTKRSGENIRNEPDFSRDNPSENLLA